MPEEIRFPVKVVVPQEHDYSIREPQGGPRKIFGDVTTEMRRALVEQLDAVHDYFSEAFQRFHNVPAVARVVLQHDALAKSHRPFTLFTPNTCPIIGLRDFGELLISVKPQGLARLSDTISRNDSRQSLANISTLDRIEPYRPEDVLRSSDAQSALQRLFQGPPPLKFRLFNHRNSALNDRLVHSFSSYVEQIGIPAPRQIDYGPGLFIYRFNEISPDQLVSLASFIGTQQLSHFSTYRAVRTASTPLRQTTPGDFPSPDPEFPYPVVGLIDTGVNPNDPLLAPWTVGRREYVPAAYRDFNHGTFVAGLIVNARHLNHSDLRFPSCQSKFLDVVAVPGHSDKISEDELLTILEDVIPKHPDIKVWNLSLSRCDGPACSDNTFSDFAVFLDRLQDRYGVTFVLAAGNYDTEPFRGWPPDNFGEADRVCPPADSIRSLTVGSLAHVHTADSRVKAEEPSPFTRRGPGAAHLPKPEVSHYGGNCTAKGRYQQTGILSIDGRNNLAEDVGTSFATPIVSSLLANLENILGRTVTPILAKALVIHSASLSCPPADARSLRYRGFGTPGDLTNILTCTPWMATLIFEPNIVPNLNFIKDRFPIPPSLRTDEGKVRAEFLMTLVYNPPLDPIFGSEYCRRNIEASLGTYDIGKDGKPSHHKRVPEEPRDIRQLYERHLIENGFKWSPVKVYRVAIPNGITGHNWRLLVGAQERSGFLSEEATPTAIVISILDPDRAAPVYDEVAALMTRAGWITQNIHIEERVRAHFNL